MLTAFKCSEVAQSCPTLCNPMDCSPPSSSVRGILQARILEWVAISFLTALGPPLLQLSDGPVLQLHVTAQFYLESKGKYILEVWGHADPKDMKRERETPGPLAPLCICFFLLLLDLPYVNWASPKCCFFYLRSSLQSSDLPLFYFCGLFSSLSFSYHHSRLVSPILPT